MRYLFHSGLEKQKNNFFVYIDYVLYFYFSGSSLRGRTAVMVGIMFYQKKSRFNLELMDSKIQTTKDIIKKKED